MRIRIVARRHSPATWLSRSLLGVLLFSAVIVLRLISFSPPHVHKRASLMPHVTFQVRRLISEALPRASEEVEHRGKQQSTQALALLAVFRPERHFDAYARLLLLPLSYPDRRDAFRPRKLPSASASDDPLPS